MSPISIYLSSTLLSVLVVATKANDWSQPCFDGICDYSLSHGSGSGSGSMRIVGSSNSISDITPAAGWDIIQCDPQATSQDIRLVCTGNDSDCDHLFRSFGAEHKIVRLPDWCGSNAFARVAKAWTPTNQMVPSRLKRRSDPRPVRALRLDTNFGASDVAKTGTVHFVLQGASIPGARADFSHVTRSTFNRMRRTTARNTTANTFGGLPDLSGAFDNTNATTFPIDVDQTANLFNSTINCPPFSAGLNVDVDAKVHGKATIGLTASGTVIPPSFKEFSLFASLDADLSGSIDLKANVTGVLSSGKIPIIPAIGLPGLSFPGLLTIGPSIEVLGEAVAKLDVNVDINVGVVYNISNANFVFSLDGFEQNRDGGRFDIGDTPLLLSASPSAQSTGTIEAHLIPRLNLGFTAFDDIVQANLFMELDANAAATLELDGGVTANRTVDQGIPPPLSQSATPTPSLLPNPSVSAFNSQVGALESALAALPAAPTTTQNAAMGMGMGGVVSRNGHGSRASLMSQALGRERDVDASFGGCFTIAAGLNVTAGFVGSALLFSDEISTSLFGQEFQLFRQCFGDQTARRSNAQPTPSTLKTSGGSDGSSNSLACSSSNILPARTVTNGTVKTSSISKTQTPRTLRLD